MEIYFRHATQILPAVDEPLRYTALMMQIYDPHNERFGLKFMKIPLGLPLKVAVYHTPFWVGVHG